MNQTPHVVFVTPLSERDKARLALAVRIEVTQRCIAFYGWAVIFGLLPNPTVTNS